MNAADVLKYGHLTLCGSIDGLADSHWNTGSVCGVWSVKDIIGHLAAYEHVLEEVLQLFTGGGGEMVYINEYKAGPEFNDNQAALRKDRSVQEVLGEYNDT